MNLTVEIPTKVKITEREGEILNLLSKGMRIKEIAGLLHVSRGTVTMHINHILFKLSASNSVEAVANAFRLGILE